MQAFGRTLGCPVLDPLDVQSANHLVTLTHWRLVTPILGALPPASQEAFRGSSVMVSAGGMPCDAAGVWLVGNVTPVCPRSRHDRLPERLRDPEMAVATSARVIRWHKS